MVNHAKQVALSPRDQGNANRWRDSNDRLLDSVKSVGDAITGFPAYQQQSAPPPQSFYGHQQQQSRQQSATPNQYQSSHSLVESVAPQGPSSPIVHNRMIIREEIPAPPRPPPPVEISPPPRPPPPPEVDEEEETRAFWERYPLPSAQYQPILSAAHNLHQVSIVSRFAC